MGDGDDGGRDVFGIVERRLMPHLEASGWGEKYDLDEANVASSRRILAEEYWEAGQAFMKIFYGVVFVVGLIDHLVYLEPIVYGLVVNLAGAAIIFFSGVRDPAMISAVVDADIEGAKRELEARKMAYHNSGFGLLFLGFFLQLVAVVFLPDAQLVEWNMFRDGVPTLTRGGILLILGVFFYRYSLP